MSAYRFSEASIRKAERLVAQGRIVEDERVPHLFYAEGSAGDRHRVQVDRDEPVTWVTCTCQHGRNVSAFETSCYHAVAALLLLLRERGEDGPDALAAVAAAPSRKLRSVR